MSSTTEWLRLLAIGSLTVSGLCALMIVFDMMAGRRQRMWIMRLVWPITALWAGPLGLWAYFRETGSRAEESGEPRPLWRSAGLAATHCGSGCTLGDLTAEGLVMSLVPFTLFGQRIFAAWAVDYVLAFAFGIAFQYFTIKPMKQLPARKALLAALKADSLSLTAWQLGMYGWMAIAAFVLFPRQLTADTPLFWLMMQVAMLAGFATSYPVNWWLVKRGIKERM